MLFVLFCCLLFRLIVVIVKIARSENWQEGCWVREASSWQRRRVVEKESEVFTQGTHAHDNWQLEEDLEKLKKIIFSSPLRRAPFGMNWWEPNLCFKRRKKPLIEIISTFPSSNLDSAFLDMQEHKKMKRSGTFACSQNNQQSGLERIKTESLLVKVLCKSTAEWLISPLCCSMNMNINRHTSLSIQHQHHHCQKKSLKYFFLNITTALMSLLLL